MSLSSVLVCYKVVGDEWDELSGLGIQGVTLTLHCLKNNNLGVAICGMLLKWSVKNIMLLFSQVCMHKLPTFAAPHYRGRLLATNTVCDFEEILCRIWKGSYMLDYKK